MKTILKRNVSFVTALLLVLLCFTGCGMKPDDAKAYVQSTLDAGYKASFDEYVKITESTKEEAHLDSAHSERLRRQMKNTASCSRRFLQKRNIRSAK